MNEIKLKCPAKINLTLKIENKRPDSYHNINTIMQTVTLFDDIWLKKSNSFKLICNKKQLSSLKLNIAAQAALKFFEKINKPPQVEIKIFKKIPIQAGLGGGSSNAAYVLKGLNKLFKTNLNKNEICKLAQQIGADVPFFVLGHTIQATNIGFKLNVLKPIPKCYILILKPKQLSVSTKSAFLKHDANILTKKIKLNKSNLVNKIVKKINNNEPLTNYCELLFNDFEKSLKLKLIKTLKIKLKNLGALCCLMSGSGSSVFAIFQNLTDAQNAKVKFSSLKFFKFLCEPF